MSIISKDIQKAISLLENEELVAIPTETTFLLSKRFSKKES
jgi:L-threonylcarbamoyladenylate synthase